MKLYLQLINALFQKFIFKKNMGTSVKLLCENMGIVYIKMAQILSTQNIGNMFTEKDRLSLSSICDDVHPISYDEIKSILDDEYNGLTDEIFASIDPIPIGSASLSQVHKAVLGGGATSCY